MKTADGSVNWHSGEAFLGV